MEPQRSVAMSVESSEINKTPAVAAGETADTPDITYSQDQDVEYMND